MKARNSKRALTQGRAQKDIMLLSVSVIAVIGSVIVFQGFAERKYDTTKKGNYAASNFLVNEFSADKAIMRFEVAAGNQYCLENTDGASTGLPAVATYKSGKSIGLQANSYCFDAIETSSVDLDVSTSKVNKLVLRVR